jgi:hypothetical protein
MNPYNWELLEFPDGKTKIIILDDKNEHKDWGMLDIELLKLLPKDIVDRR